MTINRVDNPHHEVRPETSMRPETHSNFQNFNWNHNDHRM